MDLLFFSSDMAMRLQAGAVGSLLSVLTSAPEPEATITKRLFCGWVVAVFCAPLVVSLAETFLLSDKIVQRIDRADAEMMSSFFAGLAGWRGIKFFNKRAARFEQENE
jgi:hypothetical protein